MFEQVLWMITGGAIALAAGALLLGLEAAIHAARKPEGDMAEIDEPDLRASFEDFLANECERTGLSEDALLAWWGADDRDEAFTWFRTLEDASFDILVAVLSDAGGKPITATLH